MEPLITLNINKLVEQLCSAHTTNGQLMAEVEYLEGSNDDLRKENIALRDELSALNEAYKTTEGAYNWQCKETDKYKALYESLTKVAE